jgi:hypothetical protein
MSYQNLRLRNNMSLGVLAVVIQLRFNKFTASNRYTTDAKVRAIAVVELPECKSHLPFGKQPVHRSRCLRQPRGTWRPSLRSSASYTTPMPPPPILLRMW